MNGWFSCGRHLLAKRGNSFDVRLSQCIMGILKPLSVHQLYTRFCGALWDWMSALENIHYGFEHHLKWLSPQIVHYLRVWGRFWIQPLSLWMSDWIIDSLDLFKNIDSFINESQLCVVQKTTTVLLWLCLEPFSFVKLSRILTILCIKLSRILNSCLLKCYKAI